MAKTFTAISQDGEVLYKGRGTIGAAQKAIDALFEYRAMVKSASGMLYGNPMSMGRIEVDGVTYAADGFYYADDMAA